MSNMPIYPMDAYCSKFDIPEEYILRACFTSRGRFSKEGGNMRLKANKPFAKPRNVAQGCANYVWRMLCFDLVGWGKHACIPVCADFDLEETYTESRGGRIRYNQPGYDEQERGIKELRDNMDSLVQRFESNIPVEQQAGVMRWGRALGMI